MGNFPFLVDTGANINLINPKLAYSCKMAKPYNLVARNIASANGNFNATSAIDLNFFHPKIDHKATFILHKFHDFFFGIIGTGILNALNAIINFSTNTLTLRKSEQTLSITLEARTSKQTQPNTSIADASQ